jgi:hypothetical protein
MLALLRGVFIVAAIAWWSPTHEPSPALRRGADGSQTGADAIGPWAELRRAAQAEATRRALASSPLTEALSGESARSRPGREAPGVGDGPAGGSAPRPR